MKNVMKLMMLVLITLSFATEAFARPKMNRGARMKRQAKRVANGQGSYTKVEKASLKRSARRTANMRQRFTADGEWSKGEKARFQRQLNKNHRKIRRTKNNDRNPQVDTPAEVPQVPEV